MKITYFKIPCYHEMSLRQYQKIYNNSYKEYKKAFVQEIILHKRL